MHDETLRQVRPRQVRCKRADRNCSHGHQARVNPSRSSARAKVLIGDVRWNKHIKRFLITERLNYVLGMKELTLQDITPDELPKRKGPRPKTLRGPLHIQCRGHGDLRYLSLLVEEVLAWPYIEPPPVNPSRAIRIRLKDSAIANYLSAFISSGEFARIHLGTPTIYLASPLVCAHWAIVRGCAEPHYLGSPGLMPADPVVVYTTKYENELEACHFLFSESYRFACNAMNLGDRSHSYA
jgi:hypothetical protein